MLAAPEVARGMLVLRGVTAAYVPAFQTHAQMHPRVALFHALFADMYAGMGEFDSVQVFTTILLDKGHSISSVKLAAD